MKNGIIITGVIGLLAATSVALRAQDANNASVTTQNDPEPVFRGNELSLDLFGGGTLDEHDVNHINGSRIRHNGRAGVGGGLTYFIVKYIGIEGEVYSENPDHSFIDEASGNLILRIPIEFGSMGLAPYAFGGGGHQFDPFEDTFGQAGAGLEFRFTPHFGIFSDARWVFTDHHGDHGMGRAGIRFAL